MRHWSHKFLQTPERMIKLSAHTNRQAISDKHSSKFKQSAAVIKRNSSYQLTNCVANMRTVFSENRRSQRLNRSSRVEPRSSITSALYLLHGPKWSTFGTPSAHQHRIHNVIQQTLTLMPLQLTSLVWVSAAKISSVHNANPIVLLGNCWVNIM